MTEEVRLARMENSIKNVEKDIANIASSFVELQRLVIPKLTRHDTILAILAATLVVTAPIMAAWNFNLNKQIQAISDRSIILQERMRNYERTAVRSNLELGGWDLRIVTRQWPDPCIHPRAALAGQSNKYILRPEWQVQGNS